MKIKMISLLLLFLVCNSYAWTSISAIEGDGYKNEDKQQWRLRLDHMSQFKYGDTFLFFRAQNPTNKNTIMYGEFAPRLSLSKVFDSNISYKNISDTFLAGQLNYSGTGFRAYLIGAGINLQLPYFKAFQLNFYKRKNPAFKDSTYQITPMWLLPFKINDIQLSYSGFLDYIGPEGGRKTNLLSRSQILVDLGELTGKKSKTLYLGPRFSYWRNKQGLSGINEHVLEFMLRWMLE